MTKSILFLTGTRADFGKMKSLLKSVEASEEFECLLFVTGMHTLARYGYTVDEVYKNMSSQRMSEGFRNVHVFMNQQSGEPMERILANTVEGFSRYVAELNPDLIVIHGDRIEALAGAIVGALRNILVAHIEGGEISGTVDEIIRHSVTKLAHIHFTANQETAARLRQLGERPDSIFTIGSPDIDILLSDDLPHLDEVKRYYQIPFDEYAMAILHPVTTSMEETAQSSRAMVEAMVESNENYVVIYPNNDLGTELILEAYKPLRENPRFRLLPSMRMEGFLTLLRNARFFIGNSSVGIHEAPVYGVRSINVAGRQKNRFNHESILNVPGEREDILRAIREVPGLPICRPCFHFGCGDSAEHFMQALRDPRLWAISKQKQFVDL
jgi:UDP-N-acetylglucosamine 2-epimerase (hydrolysing)